MLPAVGVIGDGLLGGREIRERPHCVAAPDLEMPAVGQLEDARKEEAKASQRANDTGRDLENVKEKQSKLSRKQADLQQEINKWQTRYNASQDPKDLKKLTKAQEKLAKVNGDLAKEMRAESKVQEQMTKHQEAIPDARQDERKHGDQKEQASRQLEALKRKLDAIR